MRQAGRALSRAESQLAASASRRCASSVATVEPVHPPVQSVKPGAKPGDVSHTDKWLTPGKRSPMDWIAQVAPVEVKEGNIARCKGGPDPNLGHPVEYIVLNDTSKEYPAVCKYCRNTYYMAAHHH